MSKTILYWTDNDVTSESAATDFIFYQVAIEYYLRSSKLILENVHYAKIMLSLSVA